MVCTPHHLSDQTKNKKMSGACSTYGGQEVHTGFGWGDLGKETTCKT
jgi:hypothetical protein